MGCDPQGHGWLTNLHGRNETGLEQPVPPQVCEPLTIAHIRLATGHRFDMARVDEHDLEESFEQVEDRLPIHARTRTEIATACSYIPIVIDKFTARS